MKKFLIFTFFCCAWLTSCDKKENGGEVIDESSFTLRGGSIIVTNNSNSTAVTPLNVFPEGIPTDIEFSASRKGISLKSGNDAGESLQLLKGNDYRFKLVGEAETITIEGIFSAGEKRTVTTQATHVKITDDARYAFVSYNTKGDDHVGGVVVYNVVVTEGENLENTTATVTEVSRFVMPRSEVSAVDYYNGKLYITGATEDPAFGYNEDRDGYNYTFYMVMELTGGMKFVESEPYVTMLQSFQGTSIRVANGKVYITTGDGTKDTAKGGLFIYDANTVDNPQIKFIEGKDHIRSVDVDDDNIYMMQAQPARVTKYDLNGGGEQVIYALNNEATQPDAKSEILVWKDYLFVAENESGLRMLDKSGNVNDALDRPGLSADTDVTNSVAMNSDTKKNIHGTAVKSDMLLLANGEKGIYWYDIQKESGKDEIVLCNNNSIVLYEDAGTKTPASANFIASKGNIVFVADGLGGLKVLYIGFDEGDPPPPVPGGCDDVKQYFNNEPKSFLREMVNVFGASASANTKILFGDASKVYNEIQVLEETDLYLTYISCTASLHNTVGFFVVPAASVSMSNQDYFETVVKADFQKQSVSKNRYVLDKKYVAMSNMKNSSLVAGRTYEMKNYNRADGKFEAGDRVVMFIIPDGWVSQNSRVEFRTDQYNRPVFIDKDLNLSTLKRFVGNYYGKDDFKGIQYNSFYSEECNSLVLFFEDLFDRANYTDMDFNDMVFAITDNPEGSVAIKSLRLPAYTLNKDGQIIVTP